jgi:hypothetical protein
MANHNTGSPRTPKEELEKLPQFEPDYRERPNFSPERESHIRELLADFIRVHVRSIEWEGELTGTDRFIKNAMLAIARFEYRRGIEPNFDRGAAKEALKRTVERVKDTRQALEQIARNRELSKFLEDIFVTDIRGSHAQEAKRGRSIAGEVLSDEKIRQTLAALRRSRGVLEAYRKIAPQALADHLMSLEPILAIAVERVEFQSGDFQRDDIAQDLSDDLALAWISGTGKLPTFSKPNPRSRNKSSFAELLSLVNNSIIEPQFKHETDFRNYGVNSRNKMRKKFTGLTVSREPLRRG